MLSTRPSAVPTTVVGMAGRSRSTRVSMPGSVPAPGPACCAAPAGAGSEGESGRQGGGPR